MDEEQFRKAIENLTAKGKIIQAMHDKSRVSLKDAQNGHNYEAQQTGALLTIAEALIVHNEFQLAGIEDQLKLALQVLESSDE